MDMATDFESPRSGRELAEYAEIPLRYPFHALLPFVIVVTIAVLLLIALPKKYASSTLIMVESERVSTAMDTNRLYERLGTIQQEIQSRTRLERVIEELQPYTRYGDRPLYWQVEEMRRATHIRVQGNDAFTISFVHREPEMAMKVTNRLAGMFIENTGRLREQAFQDAKGFTQSSLDESKKMLDQAELAVRQFKEKYLGALPEQLDANLATLARLQLERQTVEASIQASENRREFTLNAIANRGAPTRVSDQAKELQELKLALLRLRQRYTEQHPDVRQVMARIAALEAEIVDAAAAAKKTADANMAEAEESENAADPGGPIGPLKNADFTDPTTIALYATIEETSRELGRLQLSRKELADRIAMFQSRVELTPKIEAQLYTLERDYQLRRQNYDLMLQRNLDAELAQRLERHFQGELFRVLDPAHVPVKPVSPNPPLFILAGLFFGAVAGIGLAGLADFFDNTVKSVKQLESIVPAPVLATTPWVGRLPGASRVRT